jgi:hypothetical protein
MTVMEFARRAPLILVQVLWLAVYDRVVSSFGATKTATACATQEDARGSS